MDIGKLIHNRRIELGKTLDEIGSSVGVSKSTVKKWESGMISNMRRDRIAHLARALDLDPVLFIGCDNNPASPTATNDILAKKRQQNAPAALCNDPKHANPMFEKYLRLDDTDQIRVEAFTDGLLASDKYEKPAKEKTYTMQFAARNGPHGEVTLTDSEWQALLDLPDVDDL